jgi:cytochrome d ubiquinol oxidase subunit I
MTPSGFIAILTGWFVTEVGRQPFTVYGVIRTSDSASPVIAEQVALTLITFVIVYTVLFGTASYYIIKLIAKGPKIITEEKLYGHSIEGAVIQKTINKREFK